MRYSKFCCAIALAIVPALVCAQASTAPTSASTTHSEGQKTISRVTGIGGISIRSKDPEKLRAWYKAHLGIDVQAWGGTAFRWADASGRATAGTTAWSISDGNNFAPSTASFMVNYRVSDLHALLAALRAEGCDVLDKTEESEYGKFGWVMDPEGNKIELWQPPEGQ